MKKRLLFFLIPAVSAVLSAVVAVSLIFGVKDLPVPNSVTVSDKNGYGISGVCIYDLHEENRLKYAYYTPDEFVHPVTLYDSDKGPGELIDLSAGNDLSNRGTLQFVVYNLDPNDEDFLEKSESLAPYLQSDKMWHFSLYLPPCFSASCVYVESTLAAQAGNITYYDLIEFCEKNGYSETHSDGTEPAIIDLSFYSRRQAIGETFDSRAKIVTVHYESVGGSVGFDGVPIIGSPDKVESIVNRDKTFLTVIALSAAFVFAILAFACALKKSLFAVPQAVLSLGVAGFTFFKLLTYSASNVPNFLSVGIHICVAIVIIAAALSLIYAIKKRRFEFLIAPPIAATFGITYLCVPFGSPILPSPIVWLAVPILGFTAFSAFAFFVSIERRNNYLTNNLQSEVARQTADLKSIIGERDKLLRYLSHDMKKPVLSIKNFVDEIRRNEDNAENVKALDIIDAKLDGLQTDFSELQKFAKLNFAAEEPQTVYTDDIARNVFDRLAPDCEANGITLKCVAPRIAVFAKRDILNSVLDNLVFNAIEHAKCSVITVSATKTFGACYVTVTDDGMGIESDRDVFLPYYSADADNENLGLGLYICRQHMLSMGGDLKYSRDKDKTVFTVSLPPA